MKQKLTVGTFKKDISGYDSFRVTKGNSFSPFSLTATFKRILVNNSACPYVVLQNDCMELCICHIKLIQKQIETDGKVTYTLTCQDYSCQEALFDVAMKIEV